MLCNVCGNHEAVCRGMCARCYARSRYREAHGIPLDAEIQNQDRGTAESAVKLYHSGMAQIEIAEHLNVSRQRIHSILQREGLL